MQTQPTYIEDPGRIIVIGDIHGDLQRLCKILYHAKVITNDLKWIADPPNTVVVQLGDQVDSTIRMPGVQEWEELPDLDTLTFLDTLDSIAQLKGGRVLSIVGNHEMMNVLGDYTYVSQRSLVSYPPENRKRAFDKGGYFHSILCKRNIVLKIGQYLFCHGGLLNSHLDSANCNLHCINDIYRKALKGIPLDNNEIKVGQSIFSMDGIIWTRFYSTVSDEQVLNETTSVLNRTISSAIFVGHSTVQNVSMKNNVVFCDNGISRSYGKPDFQYTEVKRNQIYIHTIS